MLKLITSLVAAFLPAFALASGEHDGRIAGASSVFVMDDVSMSIITGSDADGAQAVQMFRRNEGHRTFRELTAVAIPDIDRAETASIIAHRREAAEKADYWIVPVSLVYHGGNMERPDGKLYLQKANVVRLSGTGEEGDHKTHVCTSFTGKPACVRVLNLSPSKGERIPRWIDIGMAEVSNLRLRDENIVFAMILKPTEVNPKVIVGRSTVDAELVQWALVDSNTGSLKVRLPNIQLTGRTENPWIGF